MRNRIILIGGGGHCKSCIDVIEESDKYEIAGILDKAEFVGQKVLDYEILGSDDQIQSLSENGHSFLVTVGHIHSSQYRRNLFNKLLFCNASLGTVISPRAYVSKYAVVGEGSIVMHHALINAEANIGRNCILNSKSLIEHDAVVEDHCHISTAAVINGGAVVREGTFFGSNAVSKEYAKTSTDDFIKAGSLFMGEK